MILYQLKTVNMLLKDLLVVEKKKKKEKKKDLKNIKRDQNQKKLKFLLLLSFM